MASQVFLISQVCSITSLVHVNESFQCLVLILGFWSPLESVIGLGQHEDQNCDNESQGSHEAHLFLEYRYSPESQINCISDWTPDCMAIGQTSRGQ